MSGLRPYTVHVRPGRNPVVVAEGGALWAALLGPLWLFGHGMWVVGAIWLAAAAGIAPLSLWAPPVGIGAGVGLFLGTGVFARDLQRLTLRLGGYHQLDVAVAGDADAALARALGRNRVLAGHAFVGR